MPIPSSSSQAASSLPRPLRRSPSRTDYVSSIEGKSPIARLGVELHQTGGWIDAGFSGTITLEMGNVNQRPVRVYAGMPIGQPVFYTTEHAENPYFVRKGAKYLDQRQATLSRTTRTRSSDI